MRSRGSRRAAAVVAFVVAFVVAISGCSVGTEEDAVRVPADQVPFELGSGSVVPTATDSSITEPIDSIVVATGQVQVYLVRDERVAAVSRDDVATDAPAVLALLAAGPTQAETDGGLRTALVPDLATIVEVVDGMVTIDLAAGFTELAPGEQRLALAQITFSVTQLPSIDEVRFLVAGQPASVPRGDGSSTDRPVTPEDYADLAPA